jgi:hypothetical protein
MPNSIESSWRHLTQSLTDSASLALATEPAAWAEGFRYLTRLLSAGIRINIELSDVDRPFLGRIIDWDLTWGLDNPDCIYQYSKLSSKNVYRISGSVGSVTALEIQVNSGEFGGGDPSGWRALDHISQDRIVHRADRGFELFVGGAARDYNWLQLSDGPTFVLVRQYISDWMREEPARLDIECEEMYSAPLLDENELRHHLEMLDAWMTSGGQFWSSWMGALLDKPNSWSVFMEPGPRAPALHGLTYGIGSFKLSDEQALIIEADIPQCAYWSFTVMSPFNASLDWSTRQSHLNHTQGVLDEDGVFRAVVTGDEPGVANWLDTAGLQAVFFAVFYVRYVP